MNKRKLYIILSVIISLVITILLGFSGTKIVKANKVSSSIKLGNKYIAESNYKEAIIEFEKVIKIDKKNIEIKETLDVLYEYKEIENLYLAGDFDSALEKLELVKSKPKYDIIRDDVYKYEDIIYEEKYMNGMGNSIGNQLSGAYIAYKGNDIYYANPKDDGSLYKMNFETKENKKLIDGNIRGINVYNDYIYYIEDTESASSYIKKVKNDGSDNQVILETKNNYSLDIQIIDGYLYYQDNYTWIEGVANSTKCDLISINLETLESKVVNKSVEPGLTLIKRNDGTIDAFAINKYYISQTKDILNNNENGIYIDGLWNGGIIGINNEKVYFTSLDLRIIFPNAKSYYGVIESGFENNNSSKVLYAEDNINLNSRILAHDKLYFLDNGNLNSIDLNTKKLEVVKSLYQDNNRYKYKELFEVKGYLAYFDKNYDLVIDDEIIIQNLGKNDNELNDEKVEGIEVKDNILGSLPNDQVIELNKVLSFFADKNSSMNGYDRENIDMDKIASISYRYDSGMEQIETIDEKYYFSKPKSVIDGVAKKLFNIDIDTNMLSDNLHEAIYNENIEDRRGIAFKDGKYYVVAASGRFITKFALVDSIVKNNKTYTINFTMYNINDHNYFEERERFIETGQAQRCDIIGTGIAEIREDKVNGEKVYYFTKYNIN